MDHSYAELESKLALLYAAFFGRARDLPPALLARMGCPFLVLPDRSWCEADRRVATIGKLPHDTGFNKDTNCWWGDRPEVWSMQQALDYPDSVEALMGVYRHDYYERPHDSAPFGQACKRLRAAAGRSARGEIVVTNVIRCIGKDCKDSLPWKSDDEREATMNWHRGLLATELELLRPTAVVFFTGPKWDTHIREEFVGCEFEAIEGWDAGKFCRVRHPALPAYTVRAYHPNARGRSRPPAMQMLDQIERELPMIGVPGAN
jgi:hypothetical protein